jgi:hypothetical protein
MSNFITNKFSTQPTGSEELMGIFAFDDIPGLTSLTFNHSQSLGGFSIDSLNDLESISYPNLIHVDSGSTLFYTYGISLSNLPSLTTLECPQLNSVGGILYLFSTNLVNVDLPNLQYVFDQIVIGDNSNLNSINLTSLVTASFISIPQNPLLSAVTMSNWFPEDGAQFDAAGGGPGLGSALDQSSVDQILARCVANINFTNGLIKLDGDACSPPGAQGVIDYNTLISRGVSVFVN